jgi:outer membrane murein-binding lipoprotein Lpp
MSTLLAAIFSKFGGIIFAVIGALAAAAGMYIKGRGDGAAKAEKKSLKATIAEKDEQLEMHREATAAEREAVRMSEDNARKEASRWASKLS